MNIIINMSSMVPIYEQITDAVKKQISGGILKEGDALPSVRVLSKDLKISALTVKKAYDALESEGFISTVHGKGSYVSLPDGGFLSELRRKEIEEDLEAVYKKAKLCGISAEEFREMLDIITGD